MHMAWRSAALPHFREGHVRPCRNSASVPLGRCPPELVAQLALNNLHPDEDTARDGNCGLDAFARSLLHQMGRSPKAGGPVQSSRNRSKLKAADDKIALLRRVGLEWLEANAQEPLWPGMTVSKLCGVVSGTTFREYVEKMQRAGEWIDTAFLHALGAAHGANVLIFQPGMEMAIVGADLAESADEHNRQPPMTVPIALVNDVHFWGVTELLPEAPPPPVDKGEHAVFAAIEGLDLCPGPGGTRQADPTGAEDGEDPDAAFSSAGDAAQMNPGAIAAELELCAALGRWGPWSAPSAEVLQAMANVQRYRESAGKELADLPVMCTRRAEAITEMAYEEAHFAQMPPTLRYQKLARIRLGGGTNWCRHVKGANDTQQILSVCAGVQSVTALTRTLEQGACARHNRAHGPGNPVCPGLGAFTATMVYKWRVLRWSLPWASRREHLLRLFHASLAAHRATGLPDERWRVQFTFLGVNVCRDAFLVLSVLGSSVVQAVRADVLSNKV